MPEVRDDDVKRYNHHPGDSKQGVRHAALKNGSPLLRANGALKTNHHTSTYAGANAMTHKSKNGVLTAARGDGVAFTGGKTGYLGEDVSTAFFDLVFNPDLNPHIQTTMDVPKLFPKSRGNHLVGKNCVSVRFASRAEADEALNSVFDVIGLTYSSEMQALIDDAAGDNVSKNITTKSAASASLSDGGGQSNMSDDDRVSSAVSTSSASAYVSYNSSISSTMTTTTASSNSSSNNGARDGVKCSDCGQSGHKREVCPKAICSNCFEEGHLVEACPLAAFDAVTSMTISDDFQRNFTRDARDACRSAMAHISRTDVIVNNNREEIALQTSSVTCYSCGQMGHKKADCPNGNSQPPRVIQCFRCRETGHHIKDCTKESADPVDFCLNCAREGHRTVECDHAVDPESTGFCKIYLGNLNSQPTDEELEDWIGRVIGEDFCLSVVVKSNKNHQHNSSRFSFVELELPLPLHGELEELWTRVQRAQVAEKMSLKSVGEDNLVPSESWARTIWNQPPQWFNGPGILGPYHHPLRQIHPHHQQHHLHHHPHRHQQPNGQLIPDSSQPPHLQLDDVLSDFPALSIGGNIAGVHRDRAVSEGPNMMRKSSVSPPVLPPSLPSSSSSTCSELTVGVGRSPKWFRIEYLERVRAELQKLGKTDKRIQRIVQAGDVPKFFFGTCTHVVDGARFWVENLIVTHENEMESKVFRPEERKRFETVNEQLNDINNASRYRKLPVGHSGLCVFKNPMDERMLRGFTMEGEVFSIDTGETFIAAETELFCYPSWIRENDVEMQAIPVKLGDIRKMDPMRGAALLQQRIGGKKIYLRLYKKQDFHEAHVLSVEAFDGFQKSVSVILEELNVVQRQ